MLKWYNVYREVWSKETQVAKYFIQSLLCEETKVFEEIFEIDWSTIENWYKEKHRIKGLCTVKTDFGYRIAFRGNNNLRSKTLIIKQWEEPELDLQIRYRYYEGFPSIEDIISHPNKEKVAQWLREQGIMIQEQKR